MHETDPNTGPQHSNAAQNTAIRSHSAKHTNQPVKMGPIGPKCDQAAKIVQGDTACCESNLLLSPLPPAVTPSVKGRPVLL